MPGHNVLLNFPHGDQRLFLNVDKPRAGVIYTGADGQKWVVTECHERKDVVDEHVTDFEATVERLAPSH